MKLNTQILCANLPESMQAKRWGVPDMALHLGRPEFYLGTDNTLHADHLYLIAAESLPLRPVIESGAAIVLIGRSVNLPYYLNRCSVVQLLQDTDVQLVFNLLTGIYDRYDSWMEQLQTIAATTASIRQMVNVSRGIFENPIFVLNANFHFLARSDEPDLNPGQLNSGLPQLMETDELGIDYLNTFLQQKELSTLERKPMLINILDSSTLSVNLFLDGVFSGCLTINYLCRRHRECDDALAEALARMLELALRKYAGSRESETGALRKTLQDVIVGAPIDRHQRHLLAAAQQGKKFVCIKLRFNSRLAQLPMEYICSLMEKAFPAGIAFVYEGTVAAFFDSQSTTDETQPLNKTMMQLLGPWMPTMQFDVGISSPFSDLSKARFAYLQACSALENGTLFAPNEHFYPFPRYALIELLTNALGALPLELYYSEGLQRLVEHDAGSPVSYIQTLTTFLNNAMSTSRTASEMFLNRSTLNERLQRIWRELGSDLSDPDERLLCQILLKAIQLQEQIHQRMEKEDN